TVGYEWASPTRFERIQEVLTAARNEGHKLTMADMEALQLDVVSLLARRLQALLRAALESNGDKSSPAARLLLDWDGALRTESAGAALYEVWTMQLRRAVTRRALPADAPGLAPAWELYRVVLELSAPRSEWFGPSAIPARNALMLETLQNAYAE